MTRLVEILAFPFRGTALVVNATFALLLGGLLWGVSLMGPVFGLFALPALLIVLPWLAKYCLVVARHAAHGRTDSPGLTLEHVGPFELEPIALVLGSALVYQLLQAVLGPAGAALALGLLLPAAISVLVVEERVLTMLWPPSLLHYAAGLGPAYPVLVAVLALGIWLCGAVIASGAGVLLSVFLVQSILIAMCHAIGRMLHDREDAIGYERPATADEREARRAREQARKDLEDRIREWYTLAEAGKPEAALTGVTDYIAEHGDDLALYAELFERFMQWPDPTVGLALARQYVNKLMRLGRHGHALDVFRRAYATNAQVRPLGETGTLELARRARAAGHPDITLALYTDFEERFPGSRFLATALLERARLLFEEAEQPEAAAQLLERLRRDYPEAAARPEVERLHERISAARAG